MQEERKQVERGDKKKETKKEKKKRRREEQEMEEGRYEEPPKKPSSDQVPGKKPLSLVFSSTRLDPDPDKRTKILNKAKRLGRSKEEKKKKDSSSEKGSSSSSTSSSSRSVLEGGTGLFSEEDKLQRIWKKSWTASARGQTRSVESGRYLWEVNHTPTHIYPILQTTNSGHDECIACPNS